jgi:23S rRNA pseudouridine2604 synthase
MCEALGYEVFKLRRVRIMNISLDGIPNGKWRYLSDEEITEILAMCEGSVSTEDASKMNAKGQRIRKATDAKLFDSREENQASTARRNQNENRTRTYRGNNADEFRHAPNSKRGRNSSNGESGGNTENWKSNSRSERSNSDRNRSDRNRTDRDNTDRRSGKPANRSQDSNRPNKPAPKRVGGTLGLKK